MITETIKLHNNRTDVTLTTYILDDSNELRNGAKLPAVIVCPGGAYLNCGFREGEPVALAFAAMGYHAFVLRYSVALSEDDVKGWDTDLDSRSINPQKTYPQPMRDIAKAFECINDNSDKWRVDTDKIAICGFSAGGHNCAMYSVYYDKPVITDYINRSDINLKPVACVLGYPATDYIFMNECIKNGCNYHKLFTSANRHFLGDDWDSEENLLKASPARIADENTPPTFIWATAKDDVIPCQHSSLYATTLANAGVPFELHIFPDGGHGMALCDESTVISDKKMNKKASVWLMLCKEFLRNYMPLL